MPHPCSLPLAAADPDLTHWRTEPFAPFLPAPAFAGVPPRAPVAAAAILARDPGALGASSALTGWRDPFVVARPREGDAHFYVMVGAGERGRAGTALLYKSESIHRGERVALFPCLSGVTMLLLIWGGRIHALIRGC